MALRTCVMEEASDSPSMVTPFDVVLCLHRNRQEEQIAAHEAVQVQISIDKASSCQQPPYLCAAPPISAHQLLVGREQREGVLYCEEMMEAARIRDGAL